MNICVYNERVKTACSLTIKKKLRAINHYALKWHFARALKIGVGSGCNQTPILTLDQIAKLFGKGKPFTERKCLSWTHRRDRRVVGRNIAKINLRSPPGCTSFWKRKGKGAHPWRTAIFRTSTLLRRLGLCGRVLLSCTTCRRDPQQAQAPPYKAPPSTHRASPLCKKILYPQAQRPCILTPKQRASLLIHKRCHTRDHLRFARAE